MLSQHTLRISETGLSRCQRFSWFQLTDQVQLQAHAKLTVSVVIAKLNVCLMRHLF